MEAIILGNPYDIVLGAITPIDIPAYESEKAVIQLTDGYNPYLIGGTTPSGSDSYWFRYSTGLLRPLTSTDNIVIGGTSLLGTEKLRVVGKINSTSLQLGSTITISSILDEDTMVSDSNTAVPTQQSVKAYVDNQIGGYLQAGDNISLLTNDSGYIITETDPIFTSSVSYSITTGNITNWNSAYSWGNHALAGYITVEQDPVFTASPSHSITSTQISHWDSAYGWGNHALVGYIITETDPIFVASASHSIVTDDITNWNLAYTNNHTHTNKIVLDIITGSGAGTQALFNDGTYKTVLTTTAGSDTQIIYNNAGVYAGSSNMIYDGTTTTINTLLTPLLEIGNTSTTIVKDSSGNLTFYDTVVDSSYTLAALVGTATNFWTPDGNNIWYGYKVAIGGIGTFTESLEVTGNILADNFNSSYFRFINNSLLLGPQAGDSDSTSNKLYISNTNSTLIYGDFITLDITVYGSIIIPTTKAIIFGTSVVKIYTDTSDNLIFKDNVANSGVALTLSDLRSGSYYSLVSAYTDYSAVTSITGANKTIWNRASYITITGDGTKYLSDNGVYNTITSSITVTDNILKWDTSTFRPYTTKSEAGGASSNGKFYRDATDYPTATTQLVYDGDFYSTDISTRSVEIGNYLFYRGGSTLGSILSLRNWTDDWTILRVANDNESTLAMVVVDGSGEDLHVMDFYNMVYSDPKMGIRMYAHDVSTTFRPFYIEYSNANVEYQAITILPRTTLTSNDTEVKIGNVLSIKDSTTYITRDTSTNLTFTDAITGTKTLAELASTVSIVSDILYWNSSTSKYTPYSSSTSGCFDNSSTDPTGTIRLNYDGNLHVTSLYTYGSTYGVYSTTTSGTAVYGISSSGVGVRAESTSGTAVYATVSGVGPAISAYSTGTSATGLRVQTKYGYLFYGTQEGTPTSNVSTPLIYINRGHASSTYNITGNIISIVDDPTTSGTISGKILSATIGTIERISFNPRVSATGMAYLFGTDTTLTSGGIHTQWSNGTTGSIAYLNYAGTLYTNSGVILGNVSGGYYTSIQTSQGLFQVVSNSVVRTSLTPEVVDSSSAIAYLFDTHNILSTDGSKIISIRNQGTELSYFDRFGSFHIGDTSTSFAEVSKNTFQIKVSSTFRTNFTPSISDGSSAVAYMFDTTNVLSTTGAKIVSFKNNGTEKFSIDKDGGITSNSLTGSSTRIVAATSSGTLTTITAAVDQIILAIQIFS